MKIKDVPVLLFILCTALFLFGVIPLEGYVNIFKAILINAMTPPYVGILSLGTVGAVLFLILFLKKED